MSTLLGFDFGTHKIGVAVGNDITGTATPLTTLGRVKNQPDWNGISKLIQEWCPQALVVGLPHQLDDTESELADRAKRFARQLHGRFQLPVHMADEKLTSREAWSRLGGIASRDVTQIDAMAAKLIHETWFSIQPRSQ